MTNLLDTLSNYRHYSQDNGRVPGWQIGMGRGMDPRQTCIAIMLGSQPCTVTDLGCADGSLLILLHSIGHLLRGYGADLWEAGISWGRKYCFDKNLPIDLAFGSIEFYSGPRTDVCILGEVLEHVVDPVGVLQVAARQADTVIVTVPIARPPLTPDECARLATEPDEHVRAYTRTMLFSQAEAAGLVCAFPAVEVGLGWVSLVACLNHKGR